jgi:hypothetical protein
MGERVYHCYWRNSAWVTGEGRLPPEFNAQFYAEGATRGDALDVARDRMREHQRQMRPFTTGDDR